MSQSEFGWVQVQPVIDYSVRKLCVKSYPGHAKGCPNFSKCDRCPPKVETIGRLMLLTDPIWAIYNRFSFGDHVERMKKLHPSWTQRQLECCLYWQGTARKNLRRVIKSFLVDHPSLFVLDTPEACGVNVTETMKLVDIKLEWPPVSYAYQVVLAGTVL